MKRLLFYFLIITLLYSCTHKNRNLIYHSDHFSIYKDSVVDFPFCAVAENDTSIVSDFRSPLEGKYNRTISFKFSINSKDNELPLGKNHLVTLIPKGGICEGIIYRFGEQSIDTSTIGKGSELESNTLWKVRLDLRNVLRSFGKYGFYTFYNGIKLFKKDFKGVYITGSAAPLSWDFDNLESRPEVKLTDKNHDSIFEVDLIMNPQKEETREHRWSLHSNITDLPYFHSNVRLANALYNMSLEEMVKDIRPDSTFMAGAKWDGVWTRDVSYSSYLSLAVIRPDIVKISLRKKVKNKKIIQDTGSGGSWPVSTDRMTWALAAWEVFKVTGDMSWLKESYEIIKNSADADKYVVFNKGIGLANGESSFLDWREQTYPRWMEPVDIYSSFSLGTNAVHYQTWHIISMMSELLHLSDDGYGKMAESLRDSINHKLWLPEKGYYAQYLYGNIDPVASLRSEALGEALTILFDIADPERQKAVVANTPVTEYGIPCIFPEIPEINPYHNNAIWPFVQTFWALAAAKTQNETAVSYSIASIYRQSALFLSNKENMVAQTGDFFGTAINSDRQLWSVAGNLAIVYKIYFGMDFKVNGIEFKPFVPEQYDGDKTLTGFVYRNAVLNISLKGYGNHVKSFSLDGKKSVKCIVDGSLKGKHSIEIVLDNQSITKASMNLQPVLFSLPEVDYQNKDTDVLFKKFKNTARIMAYRNGISDAIQDGVYHLHKEHHTSSYTFLAIDDNGSASFINQPFLLIPPGSLQETEAENFAAPSTFPCEGYSGKGFVELSLQKNTEFTFKISIPNDGSYMIDFRYSNGSGPVNTDNKCAIRSLKEGETFLGPVVMPQRGKGEWSNWGYSNSQIVKLAKGEHIFKLCMDPFDENMNGEINTAMLDLIRFIRVR